MKSEELRMDERFLLLKRHRGFRELTDEDIQQIAADCDRLELETGHVLYRAGADLDDVYLVVHRHPASRPLTKRLVDRLQELGEHPCVLTDDSSWATRGDVPQLLLVKDGRWLDEATVRSKIAEWSAHERVLIDVAADVERDRLIRGVRLADLVLSCIRPDDWTRFARDLAEMEAREPEWR